MASSKLLLKTNHFIFPWFWSPLSMILLKVTRIHPRSQIRSKRGEGERQGWRQATTYIESSPFRGQATHSAEHRSVQGADRDRDGDQHSYGISGSGTDGPRLGWSGVQGHGQCVAPGKLVRATAGWWYPQDPEERKKKGHGETEHQISDCKLEILGNKMNDRNVYREKEEKLAGNITLATPRTILFLSGGDIELAITLIQRTKVRFIFQQ